MPTQESRQAGRLLFCRGVRPVGVGEVSTGKGAASRVEAARPEVAKERLMGVRRIDLARFGEQLVVVAQQVLGNPGDSDGKVPLTEQLDFNPDSFHGAPQKRAEATIRS